MFPRSKEKVYGILVDSYGWLGASEGSHLGKCFKHKADAERYVAEHGRGGSTFGGSHTSKVVEIMCFEDYKEYEGYSRDFDIVNEKLQPKSKRKHTDAEIQAVLDKYKET